MGIQSEEIINVLPEELKKLRFDYRNWTRDRIINTIVHDIKFVSAVENYAPEDCPTREEVKDINIGDLQLRLIMLGCSAEELDSLWKVIDKQQKEKQNENDN